MMNVNKYTKGYFMPLTVDMSWTQKEYVDKYLCIKEVIYKELLAKDVC